MEMVKVQKYYWFKYRDYGCEFCILYYYGCKNIITCSHIVTTCSKTIITTGLCIATTGIYFDYLIITDSHILTTGIKGLLRVYIFSLRVQVQSKYNLKNQLRV